MSNLIKLFQDQKTKAGIFLEGEYELFELNLTDWNIKDYISQWKHAAKYSLKNREVSALIQNYQHAKNHVKIIRIYTIIPEEFTIHKSALGTKDGKDFFITESIVFITENEKTFISNKSFKKIKKKFGRNFPIFYFDIKRMDKFYLSISIRSDRGSFELENIRKRFKKCSESVSILHIFSDFNNSILVNQLSTSPLLRHT